jgi:hypothetical protein
VTQLQVQAHGKFFSKYCRRTGELPSWRLLLDLWLRWRKVLASDSSFRFFSPLASRVTTPLQEAGSEAAGGWLGSRLAAPFITLAPEQRVEVIALCIFGAVLLKSLLSFANKWLFARLGARIAHANCS